MSGTITADYPIQTLIADRWSPFAFDDRPVGHLDLLALLEAARWSASAANEQPWSYLIATRDEPEEHARLLSCVEDVNMPWAKFAPVLMLGCARLTLEHSGQPYATAEHDLGLASANLVFEATARGLGVHQMIHIHRERARQLYQIPEGVKPVAGLAIGYAGADGRLSESFQKEDQVRRLRKPLESFVFSGSWSEIAPLLKNLRTAL
ncbi:nitroreductase family protein [Acidipila sp. EB88]|uniref:nitroreductase family protein n=1 Tax=Acidipila sp. EB88 TaxID=2305226 RepID=UPI000F5E8C8B|nr:nitroreductase family protein [Acidipila sp. EB88]RRA47656.1 nitroreductase [Acidipila sp. EB88]